MTRLLVAALLIAAAVIAEILVPGEPAYHTGWYNVLLCAFIAILLASVRRAVARAAKPRARAAIAAVAFGASVVGLAGVASGLFAPDDRTFVGAPGQQLHVDDFGTLTFPSDARATRYAGSFVLHVSPHEVIAVEARDPRGNHLTVTQPNGAIFLSPVLLMQQRQNIAGMDLPFDTFNVPAAQRVVRAILFNPVQAAAVSHGTSAGSPAVLFAVDDEKEHPLRDGIALTIAGKTVRAGGLTLRADVLEYPSVEIIAAPNLLAVALGALLLVAGIVALV